MKVVNLPRVEELMDRRAETNIPKAKGFPVKFRSEPIKLIA